MIDDKEREIRIGRAAEELLKSEAFQSAVEAVRAAYHAAWEATPLHDRDQLEALRQGIGTLNKVVAHLQTVMAGGALTKKKIDELNQRRTGFLKRMVP